MLKIKKDKITNTRREKRKIYIWVTEIRGGGGIHYNGTIYSNIEYYIYKICINILLLFLLLLFYLVESFHFTQ